MARSGFDSPDAPTESLIGEEDTMKITLTEEELEVVLDALSTAAGVYKLVDDFESARKLTTAASALRFRANQKGH